MFRFFIGFNFLIHASLQGFTQTNDSITLRLTEFQWVALVTEDSVYQFTRFIEPDGKFYFGFGFEDSCFTQPSRSYEFDIKRKSLGINDLDYRYSSKPIDTVFSYFPVIEQEMIESSTHIPYELVAFYVMQQLGEPEINNSDQNVIRILYPCEEIKSPFSFHVFKINFTENSTYIHRTTGISKDYNGVLLTQKDSAQMKQLGVKRIERLFGKIKEMESLECKEPGKIWILEYNIDGEYKRFIISHYFARGKRELRPLTSFVSNILGHSTNYFGMWCSQ